jgi:hypothetical protein
MPGWLGGVVTSAFAPRLTDRGRIPPMQMRSVFNPRTNQYEDIPLVQFQQLLKQGKIEETATQSPYNGHEQSAYRFVDK